MRTLTNDQAHHIAIVAEAKDHLGDVAPDFRGDLARYLEFGEAPGGLLCCIIDNALKQAISEDYLPELAARAGDAFGVIKWLAEIPEEEPIEIRDTERPPSSFDLGPIEEQEAAQ